MPLFISPRVPAFGCRVSVGPMGFYSLLAKNSVGGMPWNIYSLTYIAVIAGPTHVPHVSLYSSAALKSLGSDVEDAARVVQSRVGKLVSRSRSCKRGDGSAKWTAAIRNTFRLSLDSAGNFLFVAPGRRLAIHARSGGELQRGAPGNRAAIAAGAVR